MNVHVIKMPDIGEGIAEVEVVAWHVKPGDQVHEDQALADVMTDKAAVEIPSPVQGKVISLAAKAGDVVAVGAELMRLDVDGGGSSQEFARAETSAAPSTVSPATVAKVGNGAEAAPARAAAAAPPGLGPAGQRPLASPSVRRHARELGIELRNVSGSGPEGRIEHGDLEAYAASRRTPAVARMPPELIRPDDTEQIQVIGLRRKIAQKMQESKRRIPHFAYVEEVDVTELERLRAHLNETRREGLPKLTLLPFIMRAVVLAVADYPQINAHFDDAAGIITRYRAVHLGIATQTRSGLVVPVVRHAESRDIWESAAEVLRLASAARDGKADRQELSGSTITISSLGPLGGIVSTPIINHPEVAIVGVNRIVERPVFMDGAVVARKLMNLSSSFDHRVVDGQHAAEFIHSVRRLLEVPATLFMPRAVK
jgi:2-oxoisovalerate dehydrogenase E2 component (dihydrolipoyl transacylase)